MGGCVGQSESQIWRVAVDGGDGDGDGEWMSKAEGACVRDGAPAVVVLKFWRRQAAALAGLADGRSSGSSVVYVSSPDQINHGDKLEVELHLPALNSLLLLLLLLTVETDSTWNKFECFKISGVETNQPPRVDRSLQ
jgi:hypothetical protein